MQMLHFYLLQYRFEIWTVYVGGTGSRTSWSSGERDGASAFNASSFSYRATLPLKAKSSRSTLSCFRSRSPSCSDAESLNGPVEVEVGKDTTSASHSLISFGPQVRSHAEHTSAWPLTFLIFSPRSSTIATLKPTGALLK